MPISKGSDLIDVNRRLVSAVGATEEALVDVNSGTRKTWAVQKVVDAAANTTFSACVEFPTDTRVKIQNGKIKIMPLAAVTEDATNYASIQVVYNDGAGGADTIIGSVTTQPVANSGTGNWTASVAVNIAVNAANAVVPAGSAIFLKVTKPGTGVSLPHCGLFLKGDAH